MTYPSQIKLLLLLFGSIWSHRVVQCRAIVWHIVGCLNVARDAGNGCYESSEPTEDLLVELLLSCAQ